MKINFTKKEYGALLDILEIANWIMNAHEIERESINPIYLNFEQKIYSFAKEMGFEDMVELDKESNLYYPTRLMEDTSPAHTFIDEYDNETFWEELVSRLSGRDISEQITAKKYAELPIEARIELRYKFEKKYDEEFHIHGLKNLRLSIPDGPTEAKIINLH